MTRDAASTTTPDRILEAARPVLERDPEASVADICSASGVSRATFYRSYRSRAELLARLDITPDPDARERILLAAAQLIGRDGLRGMSMDELATLAGVSRASVYRLFPGKAALFDALLAENSPFDEIERVFSEMADEPPSRVLPTAARAITTVAAPRIGLLRSIFFEVTNQSPDALAVADPRISRVLAVVARYLADQMAAGRIRRMHPLLAAQLLMGPIVFHLVSRAEMDRLAVLETSVQESIDLLVQAALRALDPGQ